MKLRQDYCDTLLNIARLEGHEVRERNISLKEGYDVVRGAIIMFMMAFDIPVEACDDVAGWVFDEFSGAVREEDDE